MKRVLNILEKPVYGNMESTDVGLFAVAYAPVVGMDIAILLRGGGVHYAVKGQDSSGIEIENLPIPEMNVARDLEMFTENGTPVYVVRQDLEERGIRPDELISGAEIIEKGQVIDLQEASDLILVW